MKTILYNPIFINPQAYYVFPQLYDIEKGDSFIEPAVYSGYLLIEDLISNTSSQVTDTREVDFTQFAGKRIRISQYTNIGAVVLGEWLLPEGEPSGPSFYQSLVDAWFMSGPSNSDKPSSITGVNGNEMQLKNFAYSLSSGFGKYTENFLNWNEGTNKSSSYAEIKRNTTTTHLALLFKYPQPNERISLIVKVTGLKEGQQLYFGRWADTQKIDIPYDGTYKINYTYQSQTDAVGFRSAGDYTDVDVTILSLPIAYEGALVFDGVDDYGICTGLPVMDDFTLICKREILNTSPGYVANKGLGNAGAFHFESSIKPGDSNSTTGVWSYGTGNLVKLEQSEVSWMTKNSYNGIVLKTGNLSDVNNLYLCRFSNSFTKAAIYYFALYSKSLSPEEIETEKERLNDEWLKRKTE